MKKFYNNKLTSPQRPTWSSKSFRPRLRSTMHLLTARLDRSGVRSASEISTQPSERTKNLTARPLSGSGRAGKLRRLKLYRIRVHQQKYIKLKATTIKHCRCARFKRFEGSPYSGIFFEKSSYHNINQR